MPNIYGLCMYICIVDETKQVRDGIQAEIFKRADKRKFDVYLLKSLNLNEEEMGVQTSSVNTLY